MSTATVDRSAVHYMFNAAATTDPGWRYRDNQDAVLVDGQIRQKASTLAVSRRSPLLVGIADGCGGSSCPERASRMVLRELVQLVSHGELVGKFARMIQQRMTSTAAGTECEGMASTLAAVQFVGNTARVVSVGDSRVYRYRAQHLKQITVDHTIANRMVQDGEITPAQALEASSLYHDLASALVASEFEDEFEIFGSVENIAVGDRWICVSDGITAVLSDADIAELVSDADANTETLTSRIVGAAKQSRKADDNLSVIVTAIDPSNAADT